MPWSPYSNYATLLFFLVVLASACLRFNTLIGIIATVIWVGVLLCVYYVLGLNKRQIQVEFARYEEKNNHTDV